MATTIFFASQRNEKNALVIRVKESPSDVLKAWTEARGLPFSVTLDMPDAETVYVNAATVAYWHKSPKSPSR